MTRCLLKKVEIEWGTKDIGTLRMFQQLLCQFLCDSGAPVFKHQKVKTSCGKPAQESAHQWILKSVQINLNQRKSDYKSPHTLACRLTKTQHSNRIPGIGVNIPSQKSAPNLRKTPGQEKASIMRHPSSWAPNPSWQYHDRFCEIVSLKVPDLSSKCLILAYRPLDENLTTFSGAHSQALKFQGPVDGGRFQLGAFPIWTGPCRPVLLFHWATKGGRQVGIDK